MGLEELKLALKVFVEWGFGITVYGVASAVVMAIIYIANMWCSEEKILVQLSTYEQRFSNMILCLMQKYKIYRKKDDVNMKNELITNFKLENQKWLNSCNKKDSTGAIMRRAKQLGYELPNTCSGAIILGLDDLESELKEEKLIDMIGFKSNDKLAGIPTINFPNIFVQQTFMRMVKDNPILLEKYESVRILMEYFQEHTVCHNCELCNGLCYNNKFEYGKLKKTISELRVLLAYIVDRQALANKILRICKINNVFRINGNGEIHSQEMLTFWINIAKRKTNTLFFTYTKSFEIFEEYLQENKLPKNMLINMSIIDGQQEKLSKFENLYSGNKFVVVNELPNKAKYVCCGNCTECGDFELGYCMKKLPKNNNTIYVEYHN